MATKRKTGRLTNGTNGIGAAISRAEQAAHSLEETATQAKAIEESTARIAAGGHDRASERHTRKDGALAGRGRHVRPANAAGARRNGCVAPGARRVRRGNQ